MTRALMLSLLLLATFSFSSSEHFPEYSPARGSRDSARFFKSVSPPALSSEFPPLSAPPSEFPPLSAPPSDSPASFPDSDRTPYEERHRSPPPPSSEAPWASVADGVKDQNADIKMGGSNSEGKKAAGRVAGSVIGLIVAAAVVSLAVLVYKKRQVNIRRSQYGLALRQDML